MVQMRSGLGVINLSCPQATLSYFTKSLTAKISFSKGTCVRMREFTCCHCCFVKRCFWDIMVHAVAPASLWKSC